MKIEPRYVTRDGHEFMTKKDALKHEKFLSYREWYLSNTLSGDSYGSTISWEDLTEWLSQNKLTVIDLLEHL